MQLLEDYKHGTLPPGVTNKEVRGKSLSYVSTASCSLKMRERGGASSYCCRMISMFPLEKSHFGSPELIAACSGGSSGPLQLNCQHVGVNLGRLGANVAEQKGQQGGLQNEHTKTVVRTSQILGFLTCTIVDYLWPTLLLPFPLQNGLAELKKKIINKCSFHFK